MQCDHHASDSSHHYYCSTVLLPSVDRKQLVRTLHDVTYECQSMMPFVLSVTSTRCDARGRSFLKKLILVLHHYYYLKSITSLIRQYWRHAVQEPAYPFPPSCRLAPVVTSTAAHLVSECDRWVGRSTGPPRQGNREDGRRPKVRMESDGCKGGGNNFHRSAGFVIMMDEFSLVAGILNYST
nr:hypothetical protein CFP56_10369 [Quercus suber]